MERWSSRVAVVTGASSGIGAAIAESLVSHGMKVIGCSRNIDNIEKLSDELKSRGYSDSLTAIRCDVCKEEDVKDLFKRVKSDFGQLDVLVNSAGSGHPGSILNGETSEWRKMLDVNVIGLCMCTREGYQLMRECEVDDGHIFLLNSLAGHRMLPGSNHFYAASKYAVTSLTEGIRNELRQAKSNIRVTAISPGMVETDFLKKFLGPPEQATQFCTTRQLLQPKDIADAVVYALGAPPHVQVHDIIMRWTQQVN